MKKSLFIISITCAFAVLFYPNTSNSNSTGSPGGKTGSPMDNGDCTSCHNTTNVSGSYISTNIPTNGYIPGSTYTITANIHIGTGGLSLHGFEVTAEAELPTTSKAGTFFITDNNTTKLVNNGNAVTHTAGGNNLSTWSFDWQAPSAGHGDVSFYASFIEAGYPQGNSGDFLSYATYTVPEALVNGVNNLSTKNDFIFNSKNKTIQTQSRVSIYDINGKLIFKTDKNKKTNLTHLKSGAYILKSKTKAQKIIIE